MRDSNACDNMGNGYEWWKNFHEFHKLAYDEPEAFDYEEDKKNGFKMKTLGECELKGGLNNRPCGC